MIRPPLAHFRWVWRAGGLTNLRALALVVLAAGGCGRCSNDTDAAEDAGPPSIPLPSALLPAPGPWSFQPVSGRPTFALPAQCQIRAPTLRAPVASSTRFVADPRSLGALVIADAPGSPPTLSGAAGLSFDSSGAAVAMPVLVPWFAADVMPRLARGPDGAWLGAFVQPGAAGAQRVALWRGGVAESIGEGDGFDAVDLGCSDRRCALLTSRLSRVAAPGADVWIGAPPPGSRSPGPGAAAFRRVEIPLKEGVNEALPVGVAAVDVGSAVSPPDAGSAVSPPDAGEIPAGVIVTVLEGDQLVFYEADDPGQAGPHEIARLAAPHGVIDAAATPAALALTYGTAVDADGCGRGPVKARLERVGLPSVELNSPAAPLAGSVRRLQRGALITWLAPLGCGVARRVVFAVVTQSDGTPLGDPVPLADGVSFAVASSGDDVDLWIQDEEAVTWVRARCAAPLGR